MTLARPCSGYGDVDSMWADMVHALIEQEDLSLEARVNSGAMSRELIGTSWKLMDPRRNFLCSEERSACPTYASAELLWYLSRSDRVDMLLPYAPSYKRFAECDGSVNGAYGHRIAHNVHVQRSGLDAHVDQLDYAVERLKRDPYTRQLVVTTWRPEDLVSTDKRDIPCTICWQFLIRKNNLHMIAYMRSNDVWLGAPYDIYAFTCIQQMLAASLGCAVGTYTHKVGSLHLYEKNVDRALRVQVPSRPSLSHGWAPCSIEDGALAVALERALRTKSIHPKFQSRRLTGCLADSVACCGRKLGDLSSPISPALLKGFENVDRRGT